MHSSAGKRHPSLSLSLMGRPSSMWMPYTTFYQKDNKATEGAEYGNTLSLTYDALENLSSSFFFSFLTPDDSLNREAYALKATMGTTCVLASLFALPPWITSEREIVDEVSSHPTGFLFYITPSTADHHSLCGDVIIPCVSLSRRLSFHHCLIPRETVSSSSSQA